MTKTLSNHFDKTPGIMPSSELIQHKKLLDNLALAVLLVDENLCLKYLNPAAEEVLGTGARHALHRALTEFIQDTDDELIQHIQDSLQSGHPITQREVCMKRLGGNEFIIDCAISPLLEKDEAPLCLLEISQVERMVKISREEHLLAETHATQNMLRGLAHEIKNPLGGLRGAAQLLSSELAEASLREYTDVIISEADRLRKLVDRMFGPNLAPAKKSLNIHNVLEHIRYLALAETPAGIEFKVDYDPSIPEVHADRDLLVQAILNIVRNAVRAVNGKISNKFTNDEVQSKQSGTVTLKTRVLRQYTIGDVMHRLVVEISISDDGPGINAKLQPQIFFPMVSGDEDGTGLGLPISQNLVNLHDGLIEFDSIPGHTEFRVLIPLNSENSFRLK